MAEGQLRPQLVRNGQRRFEGFDGKILALYARGLSVRDIEARRGVRTPASAVGRSGAPTWPILKRSRPALSSTANPLEDPNDPRPSNRHRGDA